MSSHLFYRSFQHPQNCKLSTCRDFVRPLSSNYYPGPFHQLYQEWQVNRSKKVKVFRNIRIKDSLKFPLQYVVLGVWNRNSCWAPRRSSSEVTSAVSGGKQPMRNRPLITSTVVHHYLLFHY